MRIALHTLTKSALVLVTLTGASPSFAGPLTDAIAVMTRAEGDAYLQARSEALSLTDLADIHKRRAALTVTRKTWRQAATLATLEAHLTPGAFDDLHRLQGLDPAFYLKARRAEPAVTREVSRGNIHVGALVETLLKTAEAYPFASDSSYPRNRHQDAAVLRSKEEAALRAALVTGIARAATPLSPFVLIDVLSRSPHQDARLQAAVMLGVSTQDHALAYQSLAQHLGPSVDDSLRAAIAVGLGKVRSVSSVQRLSALARNDPARSVRVAALRGLGALGSVWGLRASEHKQAGQLSASSSEALLALIETATSPHERDALVDALGMVANPSCLETLNDLQRSEDPAVVTTARRAQRRVRRNLSRQQR